MLAREGGYVHSAADPGGETNFGISKRFNPEVDIKNLTVDGAKEIFFRKYWTEAKCQQIADRFPELATVVMDTAVLCGPVNAVAFIPSEYLSQFICDSNVKKNILKEYLLTRIQYHTAKTMANRKKEVFFLGWINRVMLLKKEVGI